MARKNVRNLISDHASVAADMLDDQTTARQIAMEEDRFRGMPVRIAAQRSGRKVRPGEPGVIHFQVLDGATNS